MIRHRIKLSVVIGTVIFGTVAGPMFLFSEETSPAGNKAASADQQAIQQSAEEFVAVFNRHDSKTLANMWTEDGEYVDENGQRYQGRAAIAREYERFFSAHADIRLKLSVDEIRMIGPATAIEDGRASLEPQPQGAPATSRYTAIHLKQNGLWKLASVRDARVEVRSTYGHLKDLAWIVGDWTAEHAGTRADVQVQWTAQKSYIQKLYSVTRDGHLVSSSTEIIGWDPLHGGIKSWTFTSQGGRATGVWTPHETGWLVNTEGVTGDGKLTKAKNSWTRLNGGALGWKSFRRSVDGVPIDDPRDVVFKRKKKTPVNNR